MAMREQGSHESEPAEGADDSAGVTRVPCHCAAVTGHSPFDEKRDNIKVIAMIAT